jgi:hypothetical protein
MIGVVIRMAIEETESSIICYFSPMFYITDRKRCANYVIEKYGHTIPDDEIPAIYDVLRRADNVDELELLLEKLGRLIGKMIITSPYPS